MAGAEELATLSTASNYTSLYYYTFTYTFTPYPGNESVAVIREYSLSKDADKVISILLPILSVPGVLLNLAVMWNLFRGASGLNRPTRQLHGHLMFSNFLILILCVPAMSLILYKGRKFPGKETGTFQLPEIFCNMTGFIWNAMTRITVHISTMTAVDRVLAVQFPVFYKFKINRHGYLPVLGALWLLNCATAATPYYVEKHYTQTVYESICTWNLNILLNKTDNSNIKSLVIYFYLFILFTLPLILAIISCVWVIVVLLKKNLKVNIRTKERVEAPPYKELGQDEPVLGRRLGLGKECSAGRMVLRSPVAMMRSPVAMMTQMSQNRKLSISIDSKIKRACITMLMVMMLQFFSYSITQLMTIDHLFFHVYHKNIFFSHSHNPIQEQIFLNYPLPIIAFSLLIPVLIHFRMTRIRKPAGQNKPKLATLKSDLC